MYSLYEEDSSFNKDYTNGTAVRHAAMQISHKG